MDSGFYMNTLASNTSDRTNSLGEILVGLINTRIHGILACSSLALSFPRLSLGIRNSDILRGSGNCARASLVFLVESPSVCLCHSFRILQNIINNYIPHSHFSPLNAALVESLKAEGRVGGPLFTISAGLIVSVSKARALVVANTPSWVHSGC